jgi:hypothetical protein
MPTNSGQNYKNHVRFDPGFHFTVVPASIALIVFAAIQLKRHSDDPKTWFMLATALVIFWTLFKLRLYALKNQDRIIRLEETLRMSKLCPDAAARANELDSHQFTALRFCSDAELPALAKKALDEKLSNKAIKESIKDWRADYSRI